MDDVRVAAAHGADSRGVDVDAVVVGAGFAGLYMLHRLRGLGMSVRVFEAAEGVGGTWFWNRYPGARCDSESHYYCFSFSEEMLQEWEWSSRYPEQPEILRYLNYVTDKLDLRRDITVQHPHHRRALRRGSQSAGRSRRKPARAVTARFLITAVGCLSTAQIPSIKGLETFAGQTYHTGRWPHEGVDFTGKRVGIIGTGSSGIQSIPGHRQRRPRTSRFSSGRPTLPFRPATNRSPTACSARSRKTMPRSGARSASRPSAFRSTSRAVRPRCHARGAERKFEELWDIGGFRLLLTSYNDLIMNKEANDTAADYIRARRSGTIVNDPAMAEKLTPRSYPVRHQATADRHELLRNVQPRQRHPGRHQGNSPIEEITPEGHPHERRANTNSMRSFSPPASTP